MTIETDRRSTRDAFELAHRILTSPPVPGQERRRAPRHPYRVVQWIAPYHGSVFPDSTKFFPVRCRDLSQSGFSFVLSRRDLARFAGPSRGRLSQGGASFDVFRIPDSATLVVCLGAPSNPVHMVAEIVRCHKVRLLGGGHIEIVDDAEGDGDTCDPGDRTFLVGCRFKGRVQ